jgi:hypothetical protein
MKLFRFKYINILREIIENNQFIFSPEFGRTKASIFCSIGASQDALLAKSLYSLDSASNYSTIQKLKPWLQTQDIPMKWEDSYVFYFLNTELKY